MRFVRSVRMVASRRAGRRARLAMGLIALPILSVSAGCKKSPPPAPATSKTVTAKRAPKPVAAAKPAPTPHASDNPTPDHRAFDELLHSWVMDGNVAYAEWKTAAKARAKLRGYLDSLSKTDLSGIRGSDAELAFWINAYNACVIEAVLDAWPLTSVKKVPGFFKKRKFTLAGKSLTLDEIENKMIRPRFREPRVHFALVCAASGCPPLQSAAFSQKNLRADLENLTKNFLQGAPGVERVKGARKIRISRLFDWYKSDFVAFSKSVWDFIRRYRRDLAKGPKPKIEFLKYDWSINAAP